ncbi:UNVERIFIED_CONTAM: hypothetical protein K2H54_044119 [Gekko kuhli]
MVMIGDNEETPAEEMIAIDLQNTEVGQLTLEQFKEFLINEVRRAAKEACKNIIKKLQTPDVELENEEQPLLYQLTFEIPKKKQDVSKKEKIQESSLISTKKRRDGFRKGKELKSSVKCTERIELRKGIRQKEKKLIERRARATMNLTAFEVLEVKEWKK